MAVTQNPEDDPPVIVLETMSQLDSFAGVEARESGKIWFPEKKWWQFWK